MSWIDCHHAPNQDDIELNKTKEPLGEKIRAELIDWLNRNKIVSVMLDTEEHCVSVDIVRLPSRIRSVLTLWGSILVRNEDMELPPIPIASAYHETLKALVACYILHIDIAVEEGCTCGICQAVRKVASRLKDKK